MSEQDDDNDNGFETENETRGAPGPEDDELGIAPDRPEAFPTERET
jgi:hypothetical protein